MYRLLMIGISLLVVSSPAGSVDLPHIWWLATVDEAHAELPAARSYRLFEEVREITIEMTISNDSEEQVAFDVGRFRDAVRFVVTRKNRVDILPTWQPVLRYSAFSAPIPVGSAELLTLEPHRGVAWKIALSRKDGRLFESGEYVIDVSLSHAIEAFTAYSGRLWPRTTVTEGQLFLRIAPPSSANERKTQYKEAGLRALTAGRPKDALELFKQAMVADPGDQTLLENVGDAYLSDRRYEEAASVLRRALSSQHPLHSGLPSKLAMAYLGMGREEDAKRALRSSGIVDDTVMLRELERLRVAARRR